MKPFPKSTLDIRVEWEKHYDGLITDRAKVDLLLMLKERRDRYADTDAGKVFSKLLLRFEKEGFKA